MNKLIRCDVMGHFYIEVPEDATPDDIENKLDEYIFILENSLPNFFAINDYAWL